jgi:PAS domain S-box-containing protein
MRVDEEDWEMEATIIMEEKKKTCSGNTLDPMAQPLEEGLAVHQKLAAGLTYTALFEQLALGIVYIDVAGRWLHVNQKFCDIVGYTSEELQQHTCQDIIYPDDLINHTDLFTRTTMTVSKAESVELRCVRKDAQLVWVKMTLSLMNSQTEQASYQIGFVEDITAQKQSAIQAEAERAAAQAYVAALHKEKRILENFMGLATHELRTPLTPIKANTQLAIRRLKNILQHPVTLLDGTDKKIEAVSGMLERVEHQIVVLNRLVGTILDISRIKSERLQVYVSPEPCNLLTIVEAAIQEQQNATPERNISVHFPVCDQIEICGDAERIGQVISHYLMNALKYSAANQPVSIELQLEQQATNKPVVRVNVQDKGQGLALEEQQRVWECFYQAPTVKVLSGSGVGLGIGLYLSRILIERHGGSVGVLSQPNVGSTFWFTLPLA